jgi:hypothetical protein
MYEEIIAGCVAGFTGTLIGYPLDVIKTTMQVSHSKSMASAAKNVYKEGGIPGFYRGVASPLAALTILNTSNFSSYAYFKKIFVVGDTRAGTGIDFRVTIAALCVAPIASAISTPFELIKTQMQQSNKATTSGAAQFKNSFDCTFTLLRRHGPLAIYRGCTANTLREGVFLTTYFTTYEHVKQTAQAFLPGSVAVPIAGGCSGALGWLVSFPLDSIKSNIQALLVTAADGSMTKYNTFEVAKQILREKGVAGLYSGVAPSIMRAFIVSSWRFSAYEFTMYMLKE